MKIKEWIIGISCLIAGFLMGINGYKVNSLDDESLDLLYRNAYYKGAVNYAEGWDETQFKIDSLEFKIQYINLR